MKTPNAISTSKGIFATKTIKKGSFVIPDKGIARWRANPRGNVIKHTHGYIAVFTIKKNRPCTLRRSSVPLAFTSSRPYYNNPRVMFSSISQRTSDNPNFFQRPFDDDDNDDVNREMKHWNRQNPANYNSGNGFNDGKDNDSDSDDSMEDSGVDGDRPNRPPIPPSGSGDGPRGPPPPPPPPAGGTSQSRNREYKEEKDDGVGLGLDMDDDEYTRNSEKEPIIREYKEEKDNKEANRNKDYIHPKDEFKYNAEGEIVPPPPRENKEEKDNKESKRTSESMSQRVRNAAAERATAIGRSAKDAAVSGAKSIGRSAKNAAIGGAKAIGRSAKNAAIEGAKAIGSGVKNAFVNVAEDVWRRNKGSEVVSNMQRDVRSAIRASARSQGNRLVGALPSSASIIGETIMDSLFEGKNITTRLTNSIYGKTKSLTSNALSSFAGYMQTKLSRSKPKQRLQRPSNFDFVTRDEKENLEPTTTNSEQERQSIDWNEIDRWLNVHRSENEPQYVSPAKRENELKSQKRSLNLDQILVKNEDDEKRQLFETLNKSSQENTNLTIKLADDAKRPSRIPILKSEQARSNLSIRLAPGSINPFERNRTHPSRIPILKSERKGIERKVAERKIPESQVITPDFLRYNRENLGFGSTENTYRNSADRQIASQPQIGQGISPPQTRAMRKKQTVKKR